MSKEGWRICNNIKSQKSIKGEDVKCVKTQKIKCWEHLQRLEDIKIVKKITNWNTTGVRT